MRGSLSHGLAVSAKTRPEDDGYRTARLTALRLSAGAKAALRELARIEAVVGMVKAEPDFAEHPAAIEPEATMKVAPFSGRADDYNVIRRGLSRRSKDNAGELKRAKSA